jgi:hypothetical protein
MTVLQLCKSHTVFWGRVFEAFTNNFEEVGILIRDKLTFNVSIRREPRA